MYADVDDRLSGVKIRRADALAPSGRGNEDVRPARDLRGIFGFRVTERHRRAAAQQKHRRRAPDDEAAPEYDGVFPLDGNLIKLQQLRHRLRRAGGEPPVRPGIHRGERALRCAVHVLFRRDGAQYARLVQRRGQRAQQQYAVYRCIGAQTAQRFFQCHAGNVLRKGNAPRFDAGGGAALHGGTLVGQIVLARSKAHDGERRDDALFAQAGYELRRFFVERGSSGRSAEKHAHRASLPYTSL